MLARGLLRGVVFPAAECLTRTRFWTYYKESLRFDRWGEGRRQALRQARLGEVWRAAPRPPRGGGGRAPPPPAPPPPAPRGGGPARRPGARRGRRRPVGAAAAGRQARLPPPLPRRRDQRGAQRRVALPVHGRHHRPDDRH